MTLQSQQLLPRFISFPLRCNQQLLQVSHLHFVSFRLRLCYRSGRIQLQRRTHQQMPHLLQPLMTQKTLTRQKQKTKKSSATKLRPPLKTPNLQKKFSNTSTKPQKHRNKNPKTKTSSKLKSRSHPQATVYTRTKLATNTTMQSSSESHPLELTTEKLSESNPAAKRGA
jgi:hypothetical protein